MNGFFYLLLLALLPIFFWITRYYNMWLIKTTLAYREAKDQNKKYMNIFTGEAYDKKPK